MGAMLRSDPMAYCDLYLQPEAAFEILSELGEMGCAQFTDMNPEVQAFQRTYVSDVCRCAEMERRLRFMEAEMLKDEIYVPEAKEEPKTMHPSEIVSYENIFEEWEDDVTEMLENQANLLKSYLELTELNYILTHIGPILGDAEIQKENLFKFKNQQQGDVDPTGGLVVITGVVRRHKCFHFEMMLWRISRGNIYYRQAVEDKILLDPATGKEIRKVAFLAACHGDLLGSRMQKVISGFRANVYPCPETLTERTKMMDKIDERISDLKKVLDKTKYHRCKALRTVGKQWHSWMVQVRKAKAVFHHMNLFTLDITKNCLIGQCWVPVADLKRVQDTLKLYSDEIGTNVPSFLSKTVTNLVAPTFNRTNKFTYGFQKLINAYGDSKYGELNPGLYTIITFPFLFGLMFGDIGHAILMTLFALWMIKYEKQFMGQKSTNDIWIIMFGGRYVMLLLGLFSIYTGFIYNDMFSIAFSIKKTYFMNTKTAAELMATDYIDIDPQSKDHRDPYIFGFDPMWQHASNKIMVQNSLKMKMSIVFGTIHMIFGLFLNLCNHVHFKNYSSIYLEFIPELLLVCCLFLWLVFLIYFKWFTYSARDTDSKLGSSCAPQILILFIDMVLWKSSTAIPNCDAYMFSGQETIQRVLVSVFLACIPVLLLGKPIYLNKKNKKKRRASLAKRKSSNFRRHEEDGPQKEEEPAEEITPFSELLIYQGVHTIEFALSTVSHTASYLRLWALSLAHSELSEMLWHMILSKLALQDRSLVGIPKLFFIFAIWAFFTICILVVMEGLSAFLHTLRLHWVEFMSKFFKGGGHPFRPFSFEDILSTDGEKDIACKSKDKRKFTR